MFRIFSESVFQKIYIYYQYNQYTMTIPRFDYVFSYWIFVWYVLYMTNITSYNPKPALYFAIGFISIQLIIFLYKHIPLQHIAFFMLINMFLKLIPFYTIYYTEYVWQDVKVFIGMFIMYMVWLWINNVDHLELLLTYLSPNLINASKVKNKTLLPMNQLLSQWFPQCFQ